MNQERVFEGKAAATQRKPRASVPMMVTASAEEIEAWNKQVQPRNKRRSLSRPARTYPTGQHPKFPKERIRKQHKHPLRDEHGAVTLIGKPYELVDIHPTSREFVLGASVEPNGGGFGYTVQRKWLGGISAQRGY